MVYILAHCPLEQLIYWTQLNEIDIMNNRYLLEDRRTNCFSCIYTSTVQRVTLLPVAVSVPYAKLLPKDGGITEKTSPNAHDQAQKGVSYQKAARLLFMSNVSRQPKVFLISKNLPPIAAKPRAVGRCPPQPPAGARARF